MAEQAPHSAGDLDSSEEDGSGGMDLDGIREMGGFVFRAARRRPKLVVTTFVVVAALGLTVSATMPRTYNSQVVLLAQRSAIHTLTGQQLDDDPTKNVAAMILRRDNVVALAKEANLARRFDETRPAALRLKDRVMARLFGKLSDEDKMAIMAMTLEKKLDVTVSDTSTVTISVDWANPQLAYDLVTLVQKNFLEARYDSDVAVINDSIAVLEEHAKSELARVDTELDEYSKIVAEHSTAPATGLPEGAQARALGGRRATAAPASAPAVDPDLAKQLEEKRLQIRAREDAQQRTLDGLKQRLADAELTLTPMHPTVIALQQQVESLSQPPADLVQLRGEERSLMAQIAPLRMDVRPPTSLGSLPSFPRFGDPASSASGSASAANMLPPLPDPGRDGALQLAQSELGLAIHAYEDALARLDASKVELDITGAAYKHRYTVVTPAEVPRAPKKATAQMVGVGSVAGGLLLALVLATAMDILGGLILESWQVRRGLKLEILGEVDNPS